MMKKKRDEWKDEAERATAAIVNCGDLDRGAEIMRDFCARAVTASRPIVVIGVKVQNRPGSDRDGNRQGDGLIEVHVPAGGGVYTLADKLRELASFITGSTIDARGGAEIVILTRSKGGAE